MLFFLPLLVLEVAGDTILANGVWVESTSGGAGAGERLSEMLSRLYRGEKRRDILFSGLGYCCVQMWFLEFL